ncbi:MAG: histidinol dehydrogenase [Candidatus Dormibacteraeota bacterium]|nr:histidinol dehydrogenase [Candidatus Dormibacteraeota bacterium]
MPVERYTAEQWRTSARAKRTLDLGATPEQVRAVREICQEVATVGDAAVWRLTKRFDGWEPGPGETLEVPGAWLDAALDRLTAEQQAALRLAAQRIRAFHEIERPEPVRSLGRLKLLTRPVQRAAVYAPGGRATYPSTVLMTAIPARVAGVPHVVLATPPARDGSVSPGVLAAARLAGVDTVYRMGGAQAIAALAYGTETIPRQDVVAGPGNVYVTLAKREVFGAVGVDGVAGPTEIVVVADGSADPTLVAADLVSQLEHDPLTWGLLITDSAALADAVGEEIETQTPELDRASVVREATCCLIVAPTLGEAMQIANDFAPEHLELIGKRAERALREVENAGAVFVGQRAPNALGDYMIGPNHTLPTAQAARFSSPLGVHTFLKRTSVSRVTRKGFAALQGPARTLAELEGFGGHARAIALRGQRRSTP